MISCSESDQASHEFTLKSIYVGVKPVSLAGGISTNLPIDQPLQLFFSEPINSSSAQLAVSLYTMGNPIELNFTFPSDKKQLILNSDEDLEPNTIYTLIISKDLVSESGGIFKPVSIDFKTIPGELHISSVKIDDAVVEGTTVNQVSTNAAIEINFSSPLDQATWDDAFQLSGGLNNPVLQTEFLNGGATVLLTPIQPFDYLSKYTLTISDELLGTNDEYFNDVVYFFNTELDESPKFPIISDDELLTKVQQQTFKYFYNFAHPTSGMARERNNSGDVVTSGGTGFGIMALVVGMERNFITRSQGISQMNKIVSFLETADRFHGVWPHWINGSTGKVVPFSTKDNGGDLVETSFLVQGLLTFRQYLEPTDTVGNNLINRINTLWKTVEWDWYRKDNEQVLYWHWSPNYNWEMNFPLSGYFEQHITYVLAAASPTHSIPKSVYVNGFTKNGTIETNNVYYGYTLPAGTPSPLFWVQYSYLGLDPHFTDDYIDYWQQNVNASLINYSYCVANPKQYVGYGENFWGLTSSDNQNGYDAHSPTNDLGVITPTAALSSFPYTPEESMAALKFFYYKIGDRLWGEYGFYDAINLTEGWTADSYLAIDQGPIVVMIENHRTGLLWDLFMSAPEVQQAFTKLSFTKTN